MKGEPAVQGKVSRVNTSIFLHLPNQVNNEYVQILADIEVPGGLKKLYVFYTGFEAAYRNI